MKPAETLSLTCFGHSAESQPSHRVPNKLLGGRLTVQCCFYCWALWSEVVGLPVQALRLLKAKLAAVARARMQGASLPLPDGQSI